MINSKGNKDNKEELGIADIDVIIRIGLKWQPSGKNAWEPNSKPALSI
jgi:hypothetical protein